MSTLTNATARANELLALNPEITKTKLTAYLTLDDYSPKVVKDALATLMPAKSKPVTFASAYYGWLAEGARTLEEATAYIMDDSNSDNVKKHKSHYINIWQLTVDVRDSLVKTEAEPVKAEAKTEAKPVKVTRPKRVTKKTA